MTLPNKGMNLTRSAPAKRPAALAGYPRCSTNDSGIGAKWWMLLKTKDQATKGTRFSGRHASGASLPQPSSQSLRPGVGLEIHEPS